MYAKICAALIVTLGAGQLSFAQDQDPPPCSDEETILKCYDRILKATTPEAAEFQKADVNEDLAKALTGANSEGAATASTMNDLAQFFNALGLLSSGDSQEGTLALDLNFLLPLQDVENNNAQFKAVINTQSEPLDQLVQAFDETIREARKDSLQKDIATFGDTQFSFTWSLVNSRFGRDYSVLRDRIAPMNEGAVNRARPLVRSLDFQELVKRATVAVGASATITSFGSLPSGVREEFRNGTFAAANQRAAMTQAIQNELNRSGLNRLADLVEQQPQLLFSLAYDLRDDIVGPDKTSATVTWEMTRRNLSAFLRREGKPCTVPDAGTQESSQYDSCVRALSAYVRKDGVDLQQQWRFKLAASYHRVKSVTYDFAADNVNLGLPEQDRWEVTVAAGRPMGGVNGGRIDFELAYDSNLDNDTTNKERLKVSLTYTRRVGDMDMPFSIVYANKDEFLGEVDHRISLNLGLKFRQPSNKK